MTMITFLLCCLIEPPQSVPATPLVPMKNPIAARETTEATSTFPNSWFYTRGGQRYADNVAMEGKPLPKLSLENWRGEAVDVNNNQGKVMVIDFGQRGVAHVGGLCPRMLSWPKNTRISPLS